jgi:hypothetical protein
VERREWTAEEDDFIRWAVVVEGCRWRKIASMLPQRSDDSVRNRWNRLRAEASAESGESCDALEADKPAASKPACRFAHVKRPVEVGTPPPEEPAAPRVSWSCEEDAIIFAAVAEFGNRWFIVAQRLPGRTEHAIRNRYHRLGAMVRQDPNTEEVVELASAA